MHLSTTCDGHVEFYRCGRYTVHCSLPLHLSACRMVWSSFRKICWNRSVLWRSPTLCPLYVFHFFLYSFSGIVHWGLICSIGCTTMRHDTGVHTSSSYDCHCLGLWCWTFVRDETSENHLQTPQTNMQNTYVGKSVTFLTEDKNSSSLLCLSVSLSSGV